jgi:hypothetical protein
MGLYVRAEKYIFVTHCHLFLCYGIHQTKLKFEEKNQNNAYHDALNPDRPKCLLYTRMHPGWSRTRRHIDIKSPARGGSHAHTRGWRARCSTFYSESGSKRMRPSGKRWNLESSAMSRPRTPALGTYQAGDRPVPDLTARLSCPHDRKSRGKNQSSASSNEPAGISGQLSPHPSYIQSLDAAVEPYTSQHSLSSVLYRLHKSMLQTLCRVRGMTPSVASRFDDAIDQ